MASVPAYPFTLQNNTTADATQVMADLDNIRDAVISNAAGSGVNTDITSLTGLSTPLSVPQGGTPVFIGGTSTGSANAQVVAATNPIGYSLTSGYRISFTAGFTNVGATTLNTNATGVTAVRKNGPAGLEALTGGEIVAGDIIEALYNGTFYVLLSGSGSTGNSGIGLRTNIATGATVDLGTVPSHNAYITSSGGTITAFGSTASTSAPIYLISFAGANTLTYNATSLIIPGAGNITTSANDTAIVEYLGSGNWQVLSYTRASGAGVVAITPLPGALGLTITNNSGTPNTIIDVAASFAVMLNSSNVSITGASVAVSINCGTTGANGLDAGSLTTDTFYHVYLISNGSAVAGLASLSATAPTMPAGYTYKVRLGAMKTSGASIFYRTKQIGNRATWILTGGSNTTATWPLDSGVKGSVTVPTWTSVTISGVAAPATAVRVMGYVSVLGATAAIVAPNNQYGPSASTSSSGPPVKADLNGQNAAIPFEFNLESTAIFWASSGATNVLAGTGWVDAVNAN